MLTMIQIVEFDTALKKKDDDSLKHAWAVISALSLWINEVDQGPLMGMCLDFTLSYPQNTYNSQATKMARRRKL